MKLAIGLTRMILFEAFDRKWPHFLAGTISVFLEPNQSALQGNTCALYAPKSMLIVIWQLSSLTVNGTLTRFFSSVLFMSLWLTCGSYLLCEKTGIRLGLMAGKCVDLTRTIPSSCCSDERE